ncbi:MAG TPA: AbrB/MazE/SpoVT family DNA-binding domain-containing protein [Egibacteraceae bacterium]|nr:AbrB/MazE/SpoVT family DNA-binding domain-containing protein [Actinomycetota bacterium]HWB71107.1 AbrB/MazE/SpoVT family DNA-binding domain-containing protein [Egibacteraceae bacterium]
METTIDAAGRIVVPKALRQALGLSPGTRVRIEQHDDYLVLSHAQNASRWESRDGRLVLTAPEGTPQLTAEAVRDLLERGRR